MRQSNTAGPGDVREACMRASASRRDWAPRHEVAALVPAARSGLVHTGARGPWRLFRGQGQLARIAVETDVIAAQGVHPEQPIDPAERARQDRHGKLADLEPAHA